MHARHDLPLLQAQGLNWRPPGADHDLWPAGLDFALRPGLALVQGGDGRGKTSLLRLLAGRLAPSAGRLQAAPGTTVWYEDPRDPAVDDQRASDWLAAQAAAAPAWQPALAQALVADFDLAEHLPKGLHMLSTGSRRKLAWTAAAASGATLTLIDLPFAALDRPSCRRLAALLSQAASDARRAWVVADFAPPAELDGLAWSALIDLGD
ncbi:MAG: ATP-binding cassette domain-containing protein [Burkholderiaceae bacterium]|nr:ATP-binding cassette domain-containing protein [Burkholderiaceae bacterium]